MTVDNISKGHKRHQEEQLLLSGEQGSGQEVGRAVVTDEETIH
jgi:hypothetical protein